MARETQNYFASGKTLDDITAELGVKTYRHPSKPLVGFKYSQIDSPKTHPVVRECRGLVLEDKTWRVVAKPFTRFFNAGEDIEAMKSFDWSDFACTTKEDGSLIILYHYDGEWHVNTSGSFGLGECGFCGKTWRELFFETAKIDGEMLRERFTYVFEMWTPFNKVIRVYPAAKVFLLSVFRNDTCEELPDFFADIFADEIGVGRPERHQFKSMEEITAFLREKEASDKTFEGVVVRDRNNVRFKIKTATYLALHHLVDNGNLFNPKRLVPLVLAGECDEVLAYVPEVKPHLERVQADCDKAFGEMFEVWRESWEIESQKDFALAIVKRTPFASVLFNVRKMHGKQQNEHVLRDAWRQSADAICKRLYE